MARYAVRHNIGGVDCGRLFGTLKLGARPDNTRGEHSWVSVAIAGRMWSEARAGLIWLRLVRRAVLYGRNMLLRGSRLSMEHGAGEFAELLLRVLLVSCNFVSVTAAENYNGP
jgi:hypothetical protein